MATSPTSETSQNIANKKQNKMSGSSAGKRVQRAHRKTSPRVPDRSQYGRSSGHHDAKIDRFVRLTKVTRALVIIGCTAAFIFYIYNFFKMYWEYPTVVDVSVDFPDEPDLPAITICNHNVLKKSEVMQYNLTLYEGILNFKNHTTILRHILARLEMGELLRMSFNNTEMFELCMVRQETKDRNVTACQKSVWLYFQKKLCFVLNSKWTANNTKIQLVSNDSEFRTVLDLHPEEYFFPNQTGVEVFFHSGIALPDSRTSHFPAMGGNSYSVGIQKTTVVLMEPPYQTMCTNYTAWRLEAENDDDRLRHLGKRICYQQCLAELANHTCKPNCIPECLVFMRNYLDKYNVCTTSYKNQSICCGNIMMLKEKCSRACPLECNVQLYDIQIDSNPGYYLNQDNSQESTETPKKYLSHKYVELIINLQMVRHTIYTHNPKITSIEILGYVGGYLGIWLGVSIPLLYDYIMKILISFKREVLKKRHFKDILHHHGRLHTGDSVKTIRHEYTIDHSKDKHVEPTTVG